MTVQQNVAFTVRMPPRTKSKLRRMAKARGVSQSQFLCSLIEGRTAEAAPPKAFWDAMHELYRIRLPQYKHFTRLDTLNPNWVPERMHELLTWHSRDVRPARVRQPELPKALRSVFRPHGKPSHIYRLYLYYCYQLGILPKGTDYKPNSPFLREELRRLDQIDRETRFLVEHRIETIDELHSVMEDTQTELDRLTAERQTLRNKLRRADPAEKDILRTRKNEITAAILPLRERLKLCSGIESRSLHMQETMDLVYDNELRHRDQRERSHVKHEYGLER